MVIVGETGRPARVNFEGHLIHLNPPENSLVHNIEELYKKTLYISLYSV